VRSLCFRDQYGDTNDRIRGERRRSSDLGAVRVELDRDVLAERLEGTARRLCKGCCFEDSPADR
jgi:hypothetical protein